MPLRVRGDLLRIEMSISSLCNEICVVVLSSRSASFLFTYRSYMATYLLPVTVLINTFHTGKLLPSYIRLDHVQSPTNDCYPGGVNKAPDYMNRH